MNIVQSARSSDVESSIRESVRTIVSAEKSGDEIIDTGAKKNSHFEFQFGSNKSEEVFVYLERLHQGDGLEVMFWVDESYFHGVDASRPSIEDGDEPLAEFVGVVMDYIVDELDGDHSVRPSYHMDATPSVVFSDSLNQYF